MFSDRLTDFCVRLEEGYKYILKVYYLTMSISIIVQDYCLTLTISAMHTQTDGQCPGMINPTYWAMTVTYGTS